MNVYEISLLLSKIITLPTNNIIQIDNNRQSRDTIVFRAKFTRSNGEAPCIFMQVG